MLNPTIINDTQIRIYRFKKVIGINLLGISQIFATKPKINNKKTHLIFLDQHNYE